MLPEEEAQSILLQTHGNDPEQRRVAIATNRRETSEIYTFVRRRGVIYSAWFNWGRGLMMPTTDGGSGINFPSKIVCFAAQQLAEEGFNEPDSATMTSARINE